MSKEKIFDIVPPRRPTKSPEELLAFGKRRYLRFPHKTIIIFFIASFILGGVLVFLFLKPKAEIEIWPKIEQVSLKTEAVMAGKIFKAEKTVSQEFSATGRKFKTSKAAGTIRIYNAYSVYSQSLVATTRFVSNDGKLFRLPERVIVPGGNYQGEELVAGYIDVEVVADQPGPEYNIGPATFSIPGFVGTPKYTSFYAKSFEAMKGGAKEEVSFVSKTDLDGAKESLTKQAREEVNLVLGSLVSSEDYIMPDQETNQESIEFTPFIQGGQEAVKFQGQAKTEVKSLALSKNQLADFAKNYLRSQIPLEKELQENSLEIKYDFKNIDFSDSQLTLQLEISANIYLSIDLPSLMEMLKNKKPENIKKIIEDLPQVEKAKVKLWPFWIRQSPGNSQRINIKLRVDPVVEI